MRGKRDRQKQEVNGKRGTENTKTFHGYDSFRYIATETEKAKLFDVSAYLTERGKSKNFSVRAAKQKGRRSMQAHAFRLRQIGRNQIFRIDILNASRIEIWKFTDFQIDFDGLFVR